MAAIGPVRLDFSLTKIVRITRWRPPALTTVLADPTTDQSPQQIVVRVVVAAGQGLVLSQLGLHAGKLLEADQGWNHGHRNPLLRRKRLDTTGGMTDRMGRRTANLGRRRPEAAGVDLAGIDRVGQQAANRRRVPARPTARRHHPQRLHVPRQREQADRGFVIPGKQVLDHRRFGRLHPHPRRIAGMVRIHPIAIRRPGPRQQAPRPQLHLSSPTHPLGDQRPLVFRHRPANLQQQMVVGILAHRPVQKHDLAAPPLQFFQQYHLMDVVARQPVGVGDQHPIHLRGPDRIPQAIQARSVQTRPAVAVVAENVLRGQFPALAPKVGSQPLQLLLDRLGLGLTLRRNPDINRQTHQSPPARSASPNAAGAGKPDPTAAPHPGSSAAIGALAMTAS